MHDAGFGPIQRGDGELLTLHDIRGNRRAGELAKQAVEELRVYSEYVTDWKELKK